MSSSEVPASEPAAPAAAAATLAEAFERLSPLLPLSEAQVRAELARAGFPTEARLNRLARTASASGWIPSFRLVDIGGTRIAVPRAKVSAASSVYATAARLVNDWGATTLTGVLDQLQVVAAATVGLGFVRSILATIQDFRWLDQQRVWFFFASRPSRLLQNVQKVFAVLPELPVTRLRNALARTECGSHVPPVNVLGELCATLPGGFVNGGFVGVTRPLDRAHWLGKAERLVIEWLEERRRSMRLPDLAEVAEDLGLSRWTIRRVLESSPLVEVLPGRRFALLGV